MNNSNKANNWHVYWAILTISHLINHKIYFVGAKKEDRNKIAEIEYTLNINVNEKNFMLYIRVN